MSKRLIIILFIIFNSAAGIAQPISHDSKCSKSLVQKLGKIKSKMYWKEMIDRVRPGYSDLQKVEIKESILESEIEAYMDKVNFVHKPNFDYLESIEAPSPYTKLLGQSAKKEAQLQALASENKVDGIYSYFRYSEKGNTSTHSHLMEIWKRGESETPGSEWDSAMKAISSWANEYELYPVTSKQNVLDGFSAIVAFEKMNRLVKQLKLSPKWFANRDPRNPLVVEIPIFNYDLKTKKATITTRELKYRQWDNFTSDRRAYFEEYTTTFGLPAHPGMLLSNFLPSKRTIKRNLETWANVIPIYNVWDNDDVLASIPKSFVFTLGNLIKGIFQTTTDVAIYTIEFFTTKPISWLSGSLKWLKAKYFFEGQIRDGFQRQAFLRERLKLAYNTFETREVELGIQLNESERDLKKRINNLLINPYFAPTNISIKFAQNIILKDEKRVSGAKLVGDNINIALQNRNRFENNDYAISKENFESASITNWLRKLFQKHTKSAFLGTVVASFGLAQGSGIILDELSYVFSENPYYVYANEWKKQKLNQVIVNWTGTTRTGKKAAVDSAMRSVGLTATLPQYAVNDRLGLYTAKLLIDEEYSFYTDEELQKNMRDLFVNELLPQRRTHQKQVLFNMVHDNLLNQYIPEDIVNVMTEQFISHYPNQDSNISKLMKLFVEQSFNPTDRVLTDLAQSISSNTSLYHDLRWYFEVGHGKAYIYYYKENFGTLTPEGASAYQAFGTAPGKYMIVESAGAFLKRVPKTSTTYAEKQEIDIIEIPAGSEVFAYSKLIENGNFMQVEVLGELRSRLKGEEKVFISSSALSSLD